MAAFNIQEALIWKEKIESVIDQVCAFRPGNVYINAHAQKGKENCEEK